MVSQNRCKRKPNFLKLDCTWTELQYLLHDSYFTCILSHNLKLRYKTYVSSSKESDKFDHYSFQLELNFLMPFNHISRWPTDISSCFWSGYTKTMKMNPVAVAMIAVWSSVAVVVVVVVIGLLCRGWGYNGRPGRLSVRWPWGYGRKRRFRRWAWLWCGGEGVGGGGTCWNQVTIWCCTLALAWRGLILTFVCSILLVC